MNPEAIGTAVFDAIFLGTLSWANTFSWMHVITFAEISLVTRFARLVSSNFLLSGDFIVPELHAPNSLGWTESLGPLPPPGTDIVVRTGVF